MPEKYRWLVDINPLAQLIDLYNKALIYPESVSLTINFYVMSVALIALCSLLYISKNLRTHIIRNV